jgi:hypothetical protein
MNLAKGHTQSHGLSIVERDKLATERKMFHLSILPNTEGYEFYGFAIDGWRFKCVIRKNTKGMHVVGGGAQFEQLIGWKPL